MASFPNLSNVAVWKPNWGWRSTCSAERDSALLLSRSCRVDQGHSHQRGRIQHIWSWRAWAKKWIFPWVCGPLALCRPRQPRLCWPSPARRQASQRQGQIKVAWRINFHEIRFFLNPKISALISVQRLDFWNGSVYVASNQDICFFSGHQIMPTFLKLAVANLQLVDGKTNSSKVVLIKQKNLSWSVADQNLLSWSVAQICLRWSVADQNFISRILSNKTFLKLTRGGPFLFILVHGGPIFLFWSVAGQNFPIWSVADQDFPIWSVAGQNFPIWSVADQDFPIWSVAHQVFYFGPWRTEIFQFGPWRTKIFQFGPWRTNFF